MQDKEPRSSSVSQSRTSTPELDSEVTSLRTAALETLGPNDAALVIRALDAAVRHLRHESLVPVRVARLLLGQHADAPVTAAILLAPARAHDVLSREAIEYEYGPEVAALAEQAEHISPLPTETAAALYEQQADLLRSTVADIRLLVARVATRIIDLESPRSKTPNELRALAQEGFDLLVPLADRIGLGIMRGRLEDACFRVLEPETYAQVRSTAERIREADDVCLELLTAKVTDLLGHHGISADVQARTKSLWSLYRKMRRSELPMERIMDRLGARVIVASVPDCYTVLGILHRHFRPIPTTFYDYIALPKENGYQSLHSCVYPLREISAKPVEFQIRTRAMHAEAEFGAAAHWLYKSRDERRAERSRQRRWLEEVANMHAATIDHATFVAQLERLAYEQSVVIFLRGGEQVRLPSGSTAADLLRKLSEHPHTFTSVHVNSEPKPLDVILNDGDTVEWNEELPEYLQQRITARLSNST